MIAIKHTHLLDKLHIFHIFLLGLLFPVLTINLAGSVHY